MSEYSKMPATSTNPDRAIYALGRMEATEEGFVAAQIPDFLKRLSEAVFGKDYVELTNRSISARFSVIAGQLPSQLRIILRCPHGTNPDQIAKVIADEWIALADSAQRPYIHVSTAVSGENPSFLEEGWDGAI